MSAVSVCLLPVDVCLDLPKGEGGLSLTRRDDRVDVTAPRFQPDYCSSIGEYSALIVILLNITIRES